MTDQETPEGGALPLAANASPEVTTETPKLEGSEAGSAPAAKDPGDKPAKPPKSGEQVRIDELTRRLRESERRNERLLRMAESRPVAAPPQPQIAQPEPEKTLADFNFDQSKFTAYVVERTSKAAIEAAERKSAQEREQQTTRSRREKWDERFNAYADERPELVDGFESVDVSPGMGEALMGSEDGPLIAEYLTNNRGIASKLAKLHPFDAAREIGRIEERLAQERQKAAQKPVSQAPAPAPRIDGADPGNVEKDPSKMTDAEFSKWFRKQRKR
jgi:hypothetical protein